MDFQRELLNIPHTAILIPIRLNGNNSYTCRDLKLTTLCILGESLIPILKNKMHSMWHSFTMERAGSGFKTVGYRSSINRAIDYTALDTLPTMTQHKTLSMIKKDFGDREHLFICVVEGHFQAPTALIQLVVECDTAGTLEKIKSHYSKKPSYLMYDYHLQYKWLSDVPKAVLDEWCQY